MNESRKTLVIAIVVVAGLLAVYSGWRVLGNSGTPSDKERMTTQSGPINRMSSMLGPDASGKPRTEIPPGGISAGTESPKGMTPMERMRGQMGQAH